MYDINNTFILYKLNKSYQSIISCVLTKEFPILT